MKKARRVFEIGREKWIKNQRVNDPRWMDTLLGQNCFTLNQTMFLLSIENMCNEEQLKKWVPLTRNF